LTSSDLSNPAPAVHWPSRPCTLYHNTTRRCQRRRAALCWSITQVDQSTHGCGARAFTAAAHCTITRRGAASVGALLCWSITQVDQSIRGRSLTAFEHLQRGHMKSRCCVLVQQSSQPLQNVPSITDLKEGEPGSAHSPNGSRNGLRSAAEAVGRSSGSRVSNPSTKEMQRSTWLAPNAV